MVAVERRVSLPDALPEHLDGNAPQVCPGTYAHLFDTVTERVDPDLAIRAARYGNDAGQERAAG